MSPIIKSEKKTTYEFDRLLDGDKKKVLKLQF